jgi:hypothetical protein
MPFRYKVAERIIYMLYRAIEPKPCDNLNLLELILKDLLFRSFS